MSEYILKILLSMLAAMVAILGWFVAHRLSLSRERINRKKDLRTEYLISAYRQLAGAAHRDSDEPEAKELEKAIHDIQLFGTKEQCLELEKFIDEYQSNNSAVIDDLLILLRDDLRSELGLDQSNSKRFLFFRWQSKANKALLRTSR